MLLCLKIISSLGAYPTGNDWKRSSGVLQQMLPHRQNQAHVLQHCSQPTLPSLWSGCGSQRPSMSPPLSVTLLPNFLIMHCNCLQINPEHYVFSTFGVLHVFPNGSSINMSLADWQKEAVLFNAVSKIPFFKYFIMKKIFNRLELDSSHMLVVHWNSVE